MHVHVCAQMEGRFGMSARGVCESLQVEVRQVRCSKGV